MQKAFTQVRFQNCVLRNRIARSATNDYAGEPDGTASEAQLKIYEELAQHEVGLIFTGHISVCPEGRNDPHQNGLWGDQMIAGHMRRTEAVHRHGSKIVAQLNHSGVKAQVQAPVAPSAMEGSSGKMARALTNEEILQIEDAFAAAALRAKQAGYDGVQVHCAHGYLLSEFIDPASNKRTDSYGGSVENRFRMAAEVIQKVKTICGETYPVFIKIHVNALEEPEGYLTDVTEMLECARRLGVEAAELSGWDFAQRGPADRVYYFDAACNLLRHTELPLILVGGIRSMGDIEGTLQEGIAMASMARPFICQPDAIERMRVGETLRCVGCNGCFTCYQKNGRRCVLHAF